MKNSFSPESTYPDLMSRREFSKRAITAGTVLLTAGISSCQIFKEKGWHLDHLSHTPDLSRRLSGLQRDTIEAAQNRLLPSGFMEIHEEKSIFTPGAREVNATAYLESAMIHKYIEPEQIRIILSGAEFLNKLAQEDKKNFADLTDAEQDNILKRFQADKKNSSKWFFLVLSLTMEAFFGDPVYGGNPEELAWKWAGIQPPFPQPQKLTRPWFL